MVLQIRHPIVRAAAGAFVALSLGSSIFAQESTVCARGGHVGHSQTVSRKYLARFGIAWL
jgi:hypothetical protein